MQMLMFGTLDALVFYAGYLEKKDYLTIGEFTTFQGYMFGFLINFL